MYPRPRRRSIDSCDSDSSSHMKDKGPSNYNQSSSGSPAIPQFPSAPVSMPQFSPGPNMPQFPSGSATPHFPPPAIPQFPSDHAPPNFPLSLGTDQKSLSDAGVGPPPSYNATPPSGFRISLAATDAFPDLQTLGQPPCYDGDGSPIYIGSALMNNSVHPCKIGRHLRPYVSVPYGGGEYHHHGRYDLLPYLPAQMEFVPAENGRIPYGRRPIAGGYEEQGAKLYHAVALINGLRVPGKTGEHLSVFFFYNHRLKFPFINSSFPELLVMCRLEA